jgi:tetratricopeptide (TPR) repeat protein
MKRFILIVAISIFIVMPIPADTSQFKEEPVYKVIVNMGPWMRRGVKPRFEVMEGLSDSTSPTNFAVRVMEVELDELIARLQRSIRQDPKMLLSFYTGESFGRMTLRISFIKSADNSVMAESLLGMLFFMGKVDHDKAVTYFNNVLTKKPKDWDTITALGIIYEDKGDGAKANQMFQQALALNPNHPDKGKLSKPGEKFNMRNE